MRRIGLAIGLIVLVSILLWFDRDGLRDNSHPGRPMGFADVFYFTVVSLTTVGYGDIAPVSTQARLVNAILLTPIRLIVWAIFLGAAFELVLIRTREGFKMARLQARLKQHTIICGFGVKGQAILSELLAHGHDLANIVVIEPSEAGVEKAAALGVTALRGDASQEAMLRAAAVEKADHVLVAPHSDDQCVLICLTVRHLHPDVRLVVSAREEENVKLLYRAGADVVVAPSVSGGRLMGAAVRQGVVTGFLQDLLTFGNGLEVAERQVLPQERGKMAHQILEEDHAIVVGIYRGDQRLNFREIVNSPLEAGDVIVYVEEHAQN